jgi:cytochrome b subunit of formate dehydrogenase
VGKAQIGMILEQGFFITGFERYKHIIVLLCVCNILCSLTGFTQRRYNLSLAGEKLLVKFSYFLYLLTNYRIIHRTFLFIIYIYIYIYIYMSIYICHLFAGQFQFDCKLICAQQSC